MNSNRDDVRRNGGETIRTLPRKRKELAHTWRIVRMRTAAPRGRDRGDLLSAGRGTRTGRRGKGEPTVAFNIFSAVNDLLLPSAVSETMSSAMKIKPLVVLSLLIIVAALD